MNIIRPDTDSDIYKQFTALMVNKAQLAATWLAERNIEVIWNNWIGGHLYRLYIPQKDLLFDFEYYPVNNYEYNYIRINFDTDIIRLLEKIFPETLLDTKETEVWLLHQRACNRFLREQDVPPVYDKNVLRLAHVHDGIIYQCMVLKDNKIIRNVSRRNCSVTGGTLILLRQIHEQFGIPKIYINQTTEDSYVNLFYRILKVSVVSLSNKKKIWWSPSGTKWRIKKEDTDKYIPFYYCEDIIYCYPT